MLNISGYLNDSTEEPVLDREREMLVSSCGHYQLLQKKGFSTVRPAGRPDYQLLYIAGGSALFTLRGEERWIREGGVVLYRPGEAQQYSYALEQHPDVYWMHFFGADIEKTLRSLRLFEEPVLELSPDGEYAALFDRIIRELQLRRAYCRELCGLYAMELLTLLSRDAAERGGREPRRCAPVEKAIRLFHTRYGEPLELAACARECGVGACWLARLFRQQTGLSPKEYLTAVRIGKARELLASPDYNVSEVAVLTGYPNPLYFSRIFKKKTGLSPTEYRRRHTPV